MSVPSRKRPRDVAPDVHELITKQSRTLKDAVHAMAADVGASEAAVKKAYQRWIRRTNTTVVKFETQRLLTSAQEAQLVSFCRVLAGSGYPVKPADIQKMVKDTFGVEPSVSWVYAWLAKKKDVLQLDYGRRTVMEWQRRNASAART